MKDRILSNVSTLVRYSPYYGEVFSNFMIVETDKIQAAAVKINNKCQIEFMYNENFFNKMTDGQMRFIILHEILHIVLNHCGRVLHRDSKLSNIVADMIVNSIIKKEYNNKVDIMNGVLFPPYDYKGELLFEELYEWMLINNPNADAPTLDDHLDNDVSNDIADNIIKEMLSKCSSNSSKDIEMIVKYEKKKDYTTALKSGLSSFIGFNKVETWNKPNRKDVWGQKGFNKFSYRLNLVIDTSGSMQSIYKTILGYLNQNDIEYNVLQCDCEVKVVSKGMLNSNSLKLKGGGNTMLQPAIELIKKDYRKFNTVILTDGLTDELKFDDYEQRVLILTTNKEVVYSGSDKVKQLKVG